MERLVTVHFFAGDSWPTWYGWKQHGYLLVQQEEDPEELPPVDVHSRHL